MTSRLRVPPSSLVVLIVQRGVLSEDILQRNVPKALSCVIMSRKEVCCLNSVTIMLVYHEMFNKRCLIVERDSCQLSNTCECCKLDPGARGDT